MIKVAFVFTSQKVAAQIYFNDKAPPIQANAVPLTQVLICPPIRVVLPILPFQRIEECHQDQSLNITTRQL